MKDTENNIIGIILMVVMTVLLAAVIAVFVFGMVSHANAMPQPDCYKNVAPPIITPVINYDMHYDIAFAKTVWQHKPQILKINNIDKYSGVIYV